MKKIYNFPAKSELPKFLLSVKINWLVLYCGFRGGNKKIMQRPEQAESLSHLAASTLHFGLAATPCMLVLWHEPARRLQRVGNVAPGVVVWPVYWKLRRHGGLMVNGLNSTLSSLGSSPGKGYLLCSWVRHFTPTIPFSTAVCKWLPVSLIPGVNAVMD